MDFKKTTYVVSTLLCMLIFNIFLINSFQLYWFLLKYPDALGKAKRTFLKISLVTSTQVSTDRRTELHIDYWHLDVLLRDKKNLLCRNRPWMRNSAAHSSIFGEGADRHRRKLTEVTDLMTASDTVRAHNSLVDCRVAVRHKHTSWQSLVFLHMASRFRSGTWISFVDLKCWSEAVRFRNPPPWYSCFRSSPPLRVIVAGATNLIGLEAWFIIRSMPKAVSSE